MDVNTYPGEPHRLRQARLWYGFAAAAAAWALEGLTGVIVSAQFCPANAPRWAIPGENGVRLTLGLITIGLLIVAISGAMTALRNWRALAGHRELIRAEGRTRELFMSFGGILISIVFIVGILLAGIPLLIVEQCMRAR